MAQLRAAPGEDGRPADAEAGGPFVPRPKAAFPVKAPVGYGESGARYGTDRGGRMHEGQDIFAPAGTPLVAMRDSKVVEEGNGGGRGNYVALYSPSVDRTFVYLHMQSPAAREDRVRRCTPGERVGELGCTGSCFGDHLHLEVRRGKGDHRCPDGPDASPDSSQTPVALPGWTRLPSATV